MPGAIFKTAQITEAERAAGRIISRNWIVMMAAHLHGSKHVAPELHFHRMQRDGDGDGAADATDNATAANADRLVCDTGMHADADE